MDIIFGKELEVEILSNAHSNATFKGFLTLKDNWSELRYDCKNHIPNLLSVSVTLKNGHILHLINGSILSAHWSSISTHKVIRFHEAVYITDYAEDKFSSVKCHIPLLSTWFNPKYYAITSDSNYQQIAIQNEKEFIISFKDFRIHLYYEARIKFGWEVHFKPQTYIIVSSDHPRNRYELLDILNSAKKFFQSFFLERFLVFNLVFFYKNFAVHAHSSMIPYRNDVNVQLKGTTWYEFNEIENDVTELFKRWMTFKEQNSVIEDLFSDALSNHSSVNRFLSAMRILENLSKRIINKDIEKEANDWANSINTNGKGFRQIWILKPFILYKSLLKDVTENDLIHFIKNRNYYTHMSYKTESVVDSESLQTLTNKILAISKTLFFLEIGIRKEMIGRVMHSFKNQFYFQ